MHEVGNMLGAVRRTNSLTQDEVATAIGTSRFTINQIERGHRTLTPAMALAITKRFGGHPLNWLYANARDMLAREIERQGED